MDAKNLSKIPEYGDLFTLKDFREAEDSGCITDDDGHGFYATKDTIFRGLDCFDKVPDEMKEIITHVVWFNK
jgi:hypothetical protein